MIRATSAMERRKPSSLEVLLLIVAWLVRLCVAERYPLTSLSSSPGALAPIVVASEDECLEQCKSNSACSALSYSRYSHQCVINVCGNIQFTVNGFWDSILIASSWILEGCDVPRARFEWMLTDSCGNASSGYLSGIPGLSVYPNARISYSNPTPAEYFGQAMGTSGSSVCWVMDPPNPAVDYNFTNSFSVFGYFYRTFDGDFPYFEMSSYSDSVNSVGIKLWRSPSKLKMGVASPGKLTCNGTCETTLPYNSTLNVWENLAAIYDAKTAKVNVYLDQDLVFSQNAGIIQEVGDVTWNRVYSGCRPGDSRVLNGSVYCLKFFDVALTPAQLANVAKSCILPKIRMA